MIIAVYQSAAFIGDALDSLRAQTLPPDEVVVCDDGSTDDLESALAPYLDMAVMVRKENGGTASALNVAARTASSDYVVVLDSDDVYLPERIEAIAELATARPDLDLITTDVFLDVEGRTLALHSDFHPFPLDREGQREEVLRHCFLAVPAVRRERLLAVGGFDESLRRAVDWDCWIRLILDGCLVGLVDEPLYRYRLSTTSISGNPARNRRANVVVLEKVLREASLTREEQAIVRAGITNHSRRAVLYDAKWAVLEGAPDARRLSLRVVVGRGQPLSSRAKSAAAAVAPGLARRMVEREIAHSPSGVIELEHR